MKCKIILRRDYKRHVYTMPIHRQGDEEWFEVCAGGVFHRIHSFPQALCVTLTDEPVEKSQFPFVLTIKRDCNRSCGRIERVVPVDGLGNDTDVIYGEVAEHLLAIFAPANGAVEKTTLSVRLEPLNYELV